MWALTTTLRVELRRAKCGDCFAMRTDIMPVASLTAAPAPRPRPRVEGLVGVASRLPNVRHYILVFLHRPGLPRRTLYCAPAVHGCRYGRALRVDHRRASSSELAQNYWRNGRHSVRRQAASARTWTDEGVYWAGSGRRDLR